MKTQTLFISLILLSGIMLFSCKKEEPGRIVSVDPFEKTIAENPEKGTSLGFINVETEGDPELTFLLYKLHDNAIEIDKNTGEVTVAVPGHFDYELESSKYYEAEVTATDVDDRFITSITIHLTDVEETTTPDKTVQERLNDGESPWDIYQSDNSLLDSLYGKLYAGGRIFYLNTNDGSGLVEAGSDISNTSRWDTQTGGSFTATGATSQSIGDGKANTTAIINTLPSGTSAAHGCDNFSAGGYSDWFMPSLDELDLMYDNVKAKGYGTFANAKYWSSSELSSDPNQAWYRDFSISSGQVAATSGKQNAYKVRPIRSF